jgi:hypothetical protein
MDPGEWSEQSRQNMSDWLPVRWGVTVGQEIIAELYQRILGREADPDGLAYYTLLIAFGDKYVQTICWYLGRSDEYVDRFIKPYPAREAVIIAFKRFTPHYMYPATEQRGLFEEILDKFNDRNYSAGIRLLCHTICYGRCPFVVPVVNKDDFVPRGWDHASNRIMVGVMLRVDRPI